VHVPYAPEQVTDGAAPSMPVAEIARGLAVVVDTALASTVDIIASGGAEQRATLPGSPRAWQRRRSIHSG
jgi:pyroglutamyl-peptidase